MPSAEMLSGIHDHGMRTGGWAVSSQCPEGENGLYEDTLVILTTDLVMSLEVQFAGKIICTRIMRWPLSPLREKCLKEILRRHRKQLTQRYPDLMPTITGSTTLFQFPETRKGRGFSRDGSPAHTPSREGNNLWLISAVQYPIFTA